MPKTHSTPSSRPRPSISTTVSTTRPTSPTSTTWCRERNSKTPRWRRSSCRPNGGGEPGGALAAALDQAFGSFAAFKEAFIKSAVGNFGSGWTWLVKGEDGKVAIVNTSNAANPMRDGKKPLLTIDVWEHAYYIDYRNARPKYLDEIWKLVNWKFVAANFG
jgi:superoxide dismutase